MAGETGGTGRDLPLRTPFIPVPGWDPGGGGRIYNEMGPFYFSWTFFSAIAIVVGIGDFGPFETPGDPFPRGPQGLVPSTSGIISPALRALPVVFYSSSETL